MNKMAAIGAIVLVLGAGGLAYPYFTTQHTEDLAKVGDLKLQTTEKDHHHIPQALAGTLLVLGVVMLSAGLIKKSS